MATWTDRRSRFKKCRRLPTQPDSDLRCLDVQAMSSFPRGEGGPISGARMRVHKMGSMPSLDVTHYSDPCCPWAYSASPALAVLRWRYGSQLRWRHVMIGLTERREQYEERGYTPARQAHGYLDFRKRGMPFSTSVKPRMAGTSRACRAVVATRLISPELELAAFRALQFGQFTGGLPMDDDTAIAAALARVEGLDGTRVVGMLDSQEVIDAYEADRAESRTAEGGATEFQGKAANTDGAVRYTAPSLIFGANGASLEAGGFQSIEAYDVCIANLDRTLTQRERASSPEDLVELLASEPHGLTTREVAAVMAARNDAPDDLAAEDALIDLLAEGRAQRDDLGDGALWRPAAA
jgi:protein-disulfide isomerase-like protein with CxxC motif